MLLSKKRGKKRTKQQRINRENAGIERKVQTLGIKVNLIITHHGISFKFVLKFIHCERTENPVRANVVNDKIEDVVEDVVSAPPVGTDSIGAKELDLNVMHVSCANDLIYDEKDALDSGEVPVKLSLATRIFNQSYWDTRLEGAFAIDSPQFWGPDLADDDDLCVDMPKGMNPPDVISEDEEMNTETSTVSLPPSYFNQFGEYRQTVIGKLIQHQKERVSKKEAYERLIFKHI